MNWNRMSLFKMPNRHKRFEYIPRFYDAKKEELERKIEQAENPIDKDGKFQRDLKFRQKTADKWGNPEFKTEAMRSNVRLIIIFFIVLIAFYYLFIGLDNFAPFMEQINSK